MRYSLSADPGGDLEVCRLDTADLASVRRFVARMLKADRGIDVLVNNACVVNAPFALTPDGDESILATNFLGPFALTGLRLPLLERSGRGRVVSVGSTISTMQLWGVMFESADAAETFHSTGAYARSKLAVALFAQELQRHLHAAGSVVRSLLAHPGTVDTTNQRMAQDPSERAAVQQVLSTSGRTVDQSARPLLFAAVDDDAPTGVPIGPGGPPWHTQVQVDPHVGEVTDLVAAERLWGWAEERTGVRFLG